jgi:hypothetical protein
MKLDLLIISALVAIWLGSELVAYLSDRQKRREDAAWGRERNNLGRIGHD